MNLAAIFQVLEHLTDFKIIGCGGLFVFHNKAKNFSQAKHLRARTFQSLFSTNNKGEIKTF